MTTQITKKSKMTPANKSPMSINAKTLLRILRAAEKSTTLCTVAKLYIERKKVADAMAKLRERRDKINAELKAVTTPAQPEQFTFKF